MLTTTRSRQTQRLPHQGQVPRVEIAHGGDEGDPLAGRRQVAMRARRVGTCSMSSMGMAWTWAERGGQGRQ